MSERRITTVLAALLPLLVLGLLGMFVTVPYVALGAGDTADTLRDYQGKQIITIDGVPTHRPDGQLRFTTVSVTDGLNLYGALNMWLRGRQLAPRDAYYTPGQSREQIESANREQFVGSESSATVAALSYLKATATGVSSIVKGGPSDGKLQSGDVIVSVDGAPVTDVGSVSKAVENRRVGETVTLAVRRADGTVDVPVQLAESEGKPRLGIVVGQVPADPKLKISYDVEKVGGPSAGLMLSLGVIDMLEPGDLTGGRVVAGTGEIASDGAVGPIGGITHKLDGAKRDGATVFLVPERNCTEAVQDPPEGLQLVKVSNLQSAVDALGAIREGRAAPSC